MKKMFLLLMVTILVMACEKDSDNDKYCFKCRTTVVTSGGGIPSQTAVSSSTICDKTFGEAKSIEQAGTSTTTSTSGGVSLTYRTSTSCSQQ